MSDRVRAGRLLRGRPGVRKGRIAEWSQPRYNLDKEFVALTLLVDQGEESAAGRWSARPEQYRDLGALLAAVEDRALVLLGPPGGGKSTLLRRFELEVSEAALADAADRAPLTFFIQLNYYKPARPGEPPPEPGAWLAERWGRASAPSRCSMTMVLCSMG
jgi:hypothetical protein